MGSTNDTPIDHVSDTALWVAAYRAEENERPDALFRDPLAARLVGDRGREIARRMRQGPRVAWVVVLRTVMIDDFVNTAIKEGCDTVLNLGAGLDTRPYRMKLPSTLRWIEVDYPHMIDLKNDRLRDEKPQCQLERVKLDLADLKARTEFLTGINATSKKVLVITEGVIPYLSNDETASLADELKSFPVFQLWVVDYTSAAWATYARRGRFKRDMRNAPFKFSPMDWHAFFKTHGWKVKELRYLFAESQRLHRPFKGPLWMKISMLFMSKAKRESMAKMSGYALLDRA
jgi:methyltransferase (TIGR00027 family)